MRSMMTLCVLAVSVFSATAAEASVQSCSQRLLQYPGDVLYADLRVTAAQAQQIGWIRDDSNQQRATLQAQLGQVQNPLGYASASGNTEQIAVLQSQQAPLVQQLSNVDLTAEARVSNLLTPWQQSQCIAADAPTIVVPAPRVIVTAPAPVPVRRPIIVRQPAPRRYAVATPVPANRPVVVRQSAPPRQVVVAAPVARHPAASSSAAPVRQLPVVASRGPVAHRAPAATNVAKPGPRAPQQVAHAEGRQRRHF